MGRKARFFMYCSRGDRMEFELFENPNDPATAIMVTDPAISPVGYLLRRDPLYRTVDIDGEPFEVNRAGLARLKLLPEGDMLNRCYIWTNTHIDPRLKP